MPVLGRADCHLAGLVPGIVAPRLTPGQKRGLKPPLVASAIFGPRTCAGNFKPSTLLVSAVHDGAESA